VTTYTGVGSPKQLMEGSTHTFQEQIHVADSSKVDREADRAGLAVRHEDQHDRTAGEGPEGVEILHVHLAGTDLDFVIVRPGDLLDDAGTGRVNAGVSIPYSAGSRDDVAAFIAASLFYPGLNRTDVELTAGTTPIDEALTALAPRPWRP